MENKEKQQDESAINSVLTEIIAAFNSDDIERALSFHTENVVLIETNMPEINKKDDLRKLFGNYFEQLRKKEAKVTLSFTVLELEVAGGWAFARGEVLMTKIPKSADPIQKKGKFLSLFQKQPDGSWLRSHIFSNSDAIDAN